MLEGGSQDQPRGGLEYLMNRNSSTWLAGFKANAVECIGLNVRATTLHRHLVTYSTGIREYSMATSCQRSCRYIITKISKVPASILQGYCPSYHEGYELPCL